MTDWSKKWHGFTWGYYRHIPGESFRWRRDYWEPCWDTERTDDSEPLFQFGNVWACKNSTYEFWGKPFQHGDRIPHKNWYFIDNPEVPHLLWPSAQNPTGAKTWVRRVRGAYFTDPVLSGTERVNSMLAKLSNRKIVDWSQLIKIQEPQRVAPMRVLICPVSNRCWPNYYYTTVEDWLTKVTAACEHLGYEWDIRIKPDRKSRTDNQLVDQLNTRQYRATISQHSAAAVESLIAGVPAVTTGPNPCGTLSTPWEDFVENDLKYPEKWETEYLIDGLLANCYHKSELDTETWLCQ